MLVFEFGKYNICINVIVVGLFRLEIMNSLFERDWLNKVVIKIVFVGRWGSVDLDLIFIVLLFVSDEL